MRRSEFDPVTHGRIPNLSAIRACLYAALTFLVFDAFTSSTSVGLRSYFAGQVQSIAAINHPEYFAGEFLGALVIALILILTATGRTSDFQRVIALSEYCALFFAFWTYQAHGLIGEPFNFFSDAKTVLGSGFLPQHLSYGGEPGAAEILSVFSQMLHLSLATSEVILSLIEVTMFVTLSYLLFARFLRNKNLASLAVILVAGSNIAAATKVGEFHPANFAPFLLFPLALLVLVQSNKPEQTLLFGILVSTISITHFLDSVFLLFLLVVANSLTIYSRKPKSSFRLVAVSVVVFLAWQVFFVNGGYFASLTRLATQGENFFVSLLLTANTSGYALGRSPGWIMLVLYAGWVMNGLGAVFGISRLKSLRNEGPSITILVGGVLASILVAIVSMLLGSLSNAVYRTLDYITLFSIPALLLLLTGHSERVKKIGPFILVAVIIILSLPSFFAFNANISTSVYSTQHVASSYYLSRFTVPGTQLFGVTAEFPIESYYLLGMSVRTSSSTACGPGMVGISTLRGSNETIWMGVDCILATFQTSGGGILEFSGMWQVPFKAYLGSVPSETQWNTVNSELSRNPLVYTNGQIELFYD